MRIRAFLLIAIACSMAAAAALQEDAPVTLRPVAGSLSGMLTIDGPDGPHPVKIEPGSLRAVSRVTGHAYRPGSYNAATGRFEFADLPGDARYDVCFRTTDGREAEGIDLDFVDRRLLRLARLRRRRMGLPERPEPAFRRGDVEELLRWVRDMDDFLEQRRVLYVAGQGRRATVLAELMRTREFHGSAGGDVIWRVELWYFEKHPGGWDRLANQERILQRFRGARSQWSRIHREYYPALSGYISPEGKSEKLNFTLPAQPDASRGRPAGTPPDITTDPHVLIDGKEITMRERQRAT